MTRPISSYILFFALAYVGIIILFAVISMFISSAGSSGTVVAPFVAAMMIGEFFVKKENRVPNDAERNALTLGSFVVFMAINISLIALVFFSGGLGDGFADAEWASTLALILGVFFLVICVIVFFMMRWAYGGLTRKRAKKLLGNQSDTFD